MKSPIDFRMHLMVALGACALAGAQAGMAQQTPAPAPPAPAKPAQAAPAQAAPAQHGVDPGAGAVPQSQAPQSFIVDPGIIDDDEPTVTIHSTTRRVVVDVVVTGPDGKPVSGLSEQDFTVLEDRKPQSVRAFEVHTPE